MIRDAPSTYVFSAVAQSSPPLAGDDATGSQEIDAGSLQRQFQFALVAHGAEVGGIHLRLELAQSSVPLYRVADAMMRSISALSATARAMRLSVAAATSGSITPYLAFS